MEQNNCLLCEVVLPEYEDTIIRLKLKIQLLEQIIKDHDSNGSYNSTASVPGNGTCKAG